MPFYEYRCPECRSTFTLLRPMSERDQPADCPDCGEASRERELSAFATCGTGSTDTSGCATGST